MDFENLRLITKSEENLFMLPSWNEVIKAEVKTSVLKFFDRKRPLTTFCTGSSYEGTWNEIGMSGHGTYTMSNGTKYVGQMKDGVFHGKGVMHFPNQYRIEGRWEEGKLCEYKLYYEDGQLYKPGEKTSDRRYRIEVLEGLRPTPKCLITPTAPTRLIPEGFYDTMDGFYNPKKKCVVSYTDHDQTIRIITEAEHEWILKNCRKGGGLHTGYDPEIHENFSLTKETEDE